MKSPMIAAVLASLLATSAATAAAPAADDGVFVEGTRYSAVFSPGQSTWRLLPADGADIRLKVSPDCRPGAELPAGLWLLTRDAAGQPQLVAPSSTPLPLGHSGHVRLVACDRAASAAEPSLPLPANLLAWLEGHSGSIYVVR